jgi:hypothetical protein
MSTRDEGAYRAAGSTPASSDDFPNAADPYTPPPRPTQARATSTGSAVEPPADQRVSTDRAEDRRDRVRWGPIWAGAAVVLTVFIVLQLLFFALGWLDLSFNGRDGSGVPAGVVTGVLALIAFFVGGLTAGASTMWRMAGDGMLHGQDEGWKGRLFGRAPGSPFQEVRFVPACGGVYAGGRAEWSVVIHTDVRLGDGCIGALRSRHGSLPVRMRGCVCGLMAEYQELVTHRRRAPSVRPHPDGDARSCRASW